MALQFSTENAANFKVQKDSDGKYLTIKGINATETSAQVICNGVQSLLSIAGVVGVYQNSSRVVTEDVNDDGN